MAVIPRHQNENHTMGLRQFPESWRTPWRTRVEQRCQGGTVRSALEQDTNGVSRTGNATSPDQEAALSGPVPYAARKYFLNTSSHFDAAMHFSFGPLVTFGAPSGLLMGKGSFS